MRERNIDWLVLVAALAVVAIHVPVYFPTCEVFYLQFVVEGICKSAVPIFFVVAGYLFARHLGDGEWWRIAVKKKTVTLLIPYFLWSGVYAVATMFYDGQTPSLWRVIGLNIFEMPHFFPLWFVRNLFLLVVISPAIVPFLAKKGGAVVMLSVCFVLEALSFGDNRILPCNSIWCGLMYFSLGIVMWRYRLLAWLPICYGGIAVAGAIVLFYVSAMFSSKMPVWAPLDALGRLLMTIGLWRIMPDGKGSPLMVGAAFPVYVLHIFVLMIFTVVIPKLAFASWCGQILMSFMVFFTCVIVGRSMKRLCPRFCAIAFGGR